MMEGKGFCIISYNSRGFNDCKRDFMENLSSISGCSTFIFNQENFLLKNNEYVAKQVLPEHHLIFKPASKEGFEGRPKKNDYFEAPANLNVGAQNKTDTGLEHI